MGTIKKNNEKQTIHLFPSKMRIASLGVDEGGSANDGFYIVKQTTGNKTDYRMGFGCNGTKNEIKIAKETYDALKEEAKNNFAKMDAIVGSEKLIKTNNIKLKK